MAIPPNPRIRKSSLAVQNPAEPGLAPSPALAKQSVTKVESPTAATHDAQDSTTKVSALAESTAAGILPENRIPLADMKPTMWMLLFQQLPLSGVSRNIAANCILKDVTGNHLLLLLQDTHATIFNDEHRKRIEGAMRDYFAVPVVLRIDIGPLPSESPAAFKNRKEQERKQRATKLFTEDPVVKELIERFGAEIQHESITPLAPQDW